MHFPPSPISDPYVGYKDDPNIPEDHINGENKTVFEAPLADLLIHSEAHLPQGNELRAAKVIRRATDEDGQIIGTYHDNPLLNTLQYEVEFPDREIREYSANLIAENIYAQVDAHGHAHTLLDSIIAYDKDANALSHKDEYFTTNQGTRRRRKTTTGWNL